MAHILKTRNGALNEMLNISIDHSKNVLILYSMQEGFYVMNFTHNKNFRMGTNIERQGKPLHIHEVRFLCTSSSQS